MVKFRAFSFSAVGASHIKNGLPCQDASLDNGDGCGSFGGDCVGVGADGSGYDSVCRVGGGYDGDVGSDIAANVESDASPDYAAGTSAVANISIAIVADGHGSPQYFRSDIGSKIAADVAMKGLKEFIAHNPAAPDAFFDGNGKILLERLAKHIISAWYTCVSDVENASPLADDPRMAAIDVKYRDKYLGDPDRQYFCRAYGTTLIAVAMTDSYWFGIHIGDGKCEVLYEDASWDQPIPWDDNCFLNSTTSICDEGAINEFRYWYGFRRADGACVEWRYGVDGQDKDESKTLTSGPVAIFIGSDGVDDTYPVYENEKYLIRLYRAIILSVADKGFYRAKEQVLELAKKLAIQGSRDDVSIAGIIGDIRADADLTDVLKMQNAIDTAKDRADEAGKKADAQKISARAERIKTDAKKKRADDLRIEIQEDNETLCKKRSRLQKLREGMLKREKTIDAVENECDEISKLLTDKNADLQTAEEEEAEQTARQNEVEAAQSSAEAEAAQRMCEYREKEKEMQRFIDKRQL